MKVHLRDIISRLFNIARRPLLWAKPRAINRLSPRLLDLYLTAHGAAESILNREVRARCRVFLANRCVSEPDARVYRLFSRQLCQNWERATLPVDHSYWSKLAAPHDMAGADYFDECLQDGNGAIVLASHLGPWIFLKRELARHGFPLNPTYPHNWPQEFNTDQIARRRFLRQAIMALRENGLVGLMGDLGVLGYTEFGRMAAVPFLGGVVPFPLGAAYLSVRTCAPLLPVFSLRHLDGRYEIVCTPPIKPEHYAGSTEERATQMMACYAERLERMIKLYPYNACSFSPVFNPN